MFIWGFQEKVSNRVCLLGATLDVWCSVAGATMIDAAAVASGLAMVGATKVGVATDE